MIVGPDALTGLLFDAVLDDAAFAELPKRIMEMTSGIGATILVHTPASARVEAIHGAFEGAMQAYTDHYWRHDLWATTYEECLSKGVVDLANYITPDELLSSEIYNDLLRANGDIFQCLGCCGDLGRGERLLVAMHRGRTQARFEPELEAQLQALKPLFIHMMQARRRARENSGTLAQALLDCETDALFILGPDGLIRYANAAAQRLPSSAPLAPRSGWLVASRSADARTLARALAWACEGRGGSLLTLPGFAERFRVAVDSMPGDRHLCCVRISDLKARLQDLLARASRDYAFTAAESELAASMLRGLSLSEHASARGVTMATARTQLRGVFAKVGVRRQAELVQALNNVRRS